MLVEFISGIFFYLYSRTVQQLKAYHNSLLNVQNVLLSFKLIDDSDPKMRSEMIREMLKFLMQHKEKES